MRFRLIRSFDKFIDVRNMSDVEIIRLTRELEIDIAVDLTGFTYGSRFNIFSQRVAPIQIGYLGYPGTTGSKFMDYIIADKILINNQAKNYFSEKIIFMPNSYQVNDRRRIIADKKFSRPELGLPDNSFVFTCFNNSYKILPDVFGIWMEILKKTHNSILWLFKSNELAMQNLKLESMKRGVEPNRIIFADRVNLADHLARHAQADLFLDTFPYNAHTTASDALWAGLPLLTRMGQSFASRVTGSLLTAIDLPELITTSLEEYEALAIELATDPKKLADLKNKLAKNRLTTPLFDTPLFTRKLEEAYIQIYERYQKDLPPDHIVIH
jgi:protein O-GlcNAc transferase